MMAINSGINVLCIRKCCLQNGGHLLWHRCVKYLFLFHRTIPTQNDSINPKESGQSASAMLSINISLLWTNHLLWKRQAWSYFQVIKWTFDTLRRGLTADFCRWHILVHFLQSKVLYLIKNLIKFVLSQLVIIDLGNGLALNRHQVINTTNDVSFHWFIYAWQETCFNSGRNGNFCQLILVIFYTLQLYIMNFSLVLATFLPD